MSSRNTKTSDKIQTRLAAWDDLSTPTSTSSRGSNWLKYSAAIGCAMALATSAEATTIYTDGPVSTTSLEHGVPGTASAVVTIDSSKGGSIGSFKLFDRVFNAATTNVGAGAANGYASLKYGKNVKFEAGFFRSYGLADRLLLNFAPGASINGNYATVNAGNPRSVNFVKNFDRLGHNSASQDISLFQKFPAPAQASTNGTVGVVDGFAGLQITNDGNTYYGWVELQVTHDPEIDQVTALGWAYNNAASHPIAAGDEGLQSSATPEPGSLSLALLALGSAGVLAWRRRKNAPQSA